MIIKRKYIKMLNRDNLAIAEAELLKKLINILKINPFNYAPEILANIINEKFFDKKIILYGNGKHSQIILKNLNNPKNIIKIVDDNIGMNLEELKNSNIKYDFIIPSNHQFAFQMEKKVKSLGLKVLNLYSLDFIDYFQKKKIKIKKKDKPILVIISPNYQPEQISLNAKYISKYFDIHKVYLVDNKNIMFNTPYIKEYYIGNSIVNLVAFLQKNNEVIDKIVLRTSPLNYHIFEIVRFLFKKELIVSIMDWLIDTNKYIIKKHKYFLEMEKNILKKADKFIYSNGGGEFKNKILKKIDKPSLQYFHYLSKDFFSYKNNNIKKEIHLCYIGHIPIKQNLENFMYGIDVQEYEKLSKKNIKTHIYMTIDRNSISQKLKEKNNTKVIFHNPLPLKKLLKDINSYHFGLMLYPDEKEMKELFGRHHNTVLTTKVFAYLFAGLPIIATNDQKFLNDFITKHEIGIVIKHQDMYNLDKIIKKYDYQKMKENIKKNIDKWSVEYNYPKLLEFLKK